MAMNSLSALLATFEKAVAEPWAASLSISERIWFLVYEPEDHRRLRARLDEFELATRQAGKRWGEVSLSDLFPQWMAAHRYRENYFAKPNALTTALKKDFKPTAIKKLSEQIIDTAPQHDSLTVLSGAESLYGIITLSEVLDGLPSSILGRILVLFPGGYADNHYRLLNARDGWSYLARPIVA